METAHLSYRTRPRLFFAALVIVSGFMAYWHSPLGPTTAAAATTRTVTTTSDTIADDGNCSLREAVRFVNLPSSPDNDDCGSDAGGPYTISLTGGSTYTLSIPSVVGDGQALNGDLDILASVTVESTGGGLATINAVAPIELSRSLRVSL